MSDRRTEGAAALPAPALTQIDELARAYASHYASPHHITFTVEGLRNLFAALSVPLTSAAEGAEPTALEKFNSLMADDEETPLERLRFFCAQAMNGQDWLDAEPFFDALSADLAASLPARGDAK